MQKKDLGQVKRKSLDSLEKYFFVYSLENPSYIKKIKPSYFKNSKINFVYEQIYDYYTEMENPIPPNAYKINELVRFVDPDSEKITDKFMADLMRISINDITQDNNDDFIKKSLHSWMTTKNVKNKVLEAVEKIRSIDSIDFDSVREMSEDLREMINEATQMNYDDGLGLDFSDPEAHIQDSKKNKIPTGWDTMDELFKGGWDRRTLNILLGQSNVGKSVWLGNIAANAVKNGYNVLYVTLEMSERLVMKRLGSALLRVDIDAYDDFSKDQEKVKAKIKQLYSGSAKANKNNLFDSSNLGKLFIKEYPSGTATVAQIEQIAKKYQEIKNIKLDMIVVDYLSIMQSETSKNSTLYTNGKYLSNGLRSIAQKMDLAMVTCMQVGRDSYDSINIELSDIAESRAVIENADTIQAILRTPKMRQEMKYMLRLLKIRDGSFLWDKTHFTMNPKYLTMENDIKMED